MVVMQRLTWFGDGLQLGDVAAPVFSLMVVTVAVAAPEVPYLI